MTGLLSIHDCMPETLDRVDAILDWLGRDSIPKITFLVVPGKPWSPRDLDRLRRLVAAGHRLAAHGWAHQTTPRRLGHRLHAALLSRNVAEHLALDSAEITALMQRSFQWFAEQQLPEPSLYVPPAWALGRIVPEHRKQLPYAQIETTSGLLQREPTGRYTQRRLPLTGYEADTPLRAGFLRRWNRWQAASAQRSQRPLRISIHPDDLNLRLRDQLAAQIEAIESFAFYDTPGL
jgi:predicted deacetylase